MMAFIYTGGLVPVYQMSPAYNRTPSSELLQNIIFWEKKLPRKNFNAMHKRDLKPGPSGYKSDTLTTKPWTEAHIFNL